MKREEYLFNMFPCKMTARDLNEKRGIYKEIKGLFAYRDVIDAVWIRYTKSGYVVYNKNGYLQPIYIKVNGKIYPRIKDYAVYCALIEKEITEILKAA